MFNQLPRHPRSNYPDFNNRKYNYSRDANLDGYLRAASRLNISLEGFGAESLGSGSIEELLHKITVTDSLHEMTVYADILWDAFNSCNEILDRIAERLAIADKRGREKLVLLIRYLNYDSGLNRRSIDGKHYNEIMIDAAFYKQLAEKTKALLDRNQGKNSGLK